MDSFGDICKLHHTLDTTLNTITSRYCGVDSKCVLITESIDLVAKYTRETLIAIESWTFGHSSALAMPVVVHVDRQTPHLIAVQQPNVLTKWLFGDEKKRVDKQTFKSNIIALISAHSSVEPIVVFERGLCLSTRHAIESKRDTKRKALIDGDESIQSVDAFADDDNHIVVFLVTKSTIDANNGETVRFSPIKSVYKLTLCGDTFKTIGSERQFATKCYQNWSLSSRLSALVAASDCRDEGFALNIYSLDGISETFLFVIKSNLISWTSIAMTSAANVCVIGKTSDDYCLELWDSRYGIQFGCISLPYEPLLNDCKVIDNTIYVSCHKGVLAIPIKRDSVCLANMIGKADTSDRNALNEHYSKILQVCHEFKSADEQQFDYINQQILQSFTPLDVYISEEVKLKLLDVCSFKLLETQSEKLKTIFKTIVSLPFNEVFLVSKLKSSPINLSQILLSLRLLCELLPTNNECIIDWICVLLDAYMSDFIINPNKDTINALKYLNSKIDYYIKFYEKLGDIRNLCDIITKNMDTNIGVDVPVTKRAQYSIEYLKF